MAAIVLIATSGFTVFRHSCQKSNTSELSIIIPDFSHYQHELTDCASCCGIQDPPASEASDSDDCCDTESLLVMLDTKFIVLDFSNKIIFSIPDPVIETTKEIEVSKWELSHINTINGLPPPLAGKNLHIFLHQLNIPFPTV